MSIHPRFARAILDGTKTVEFRKRAFARNVATVVMYATAPVQRIVGTFSVRNIDVGAPPDLWDQYGHAGSVSRSEFFDYFSGDEHGVAIQISEKHCLRKPRPLASLGDVRPPQSYRYLNAIEVGYLTATGASNGTTPYR